MILRLTIKTIFIIQLLAISACSFLQPVQKSNTPKSTEEEELVEISPKDSAKKTEESKPEVMVEEEIDPAKPEKYLAINFVESERLMPVLDLAEAEQKMVFLDFYTDWCLPCKLMEDEVFTDKEIGDLMNQHFLSMKVNAEGENGRNLAAIFEIKAYPTLLFLDKKGNVLVKKVGAAFHTELKELVQQAIVQNPN
ncbi:MAG: thioredoxin family protein [Saprospiraceae bacterium]